MIIDSAIVGQKFCKGSFPLVTIVFADLCEERIPKEA